METSARVKIDLQPSPVKAIRNQELVPGLNRKYWISGSIGNSVSKLPRLGPQSMHSQSALAQYLDGANHLFLPKTEEILINPWNEVITLKPQYDQQ